MCKCGLKDVKACSIHQHHMSCTDVCLSLCLWTMSSAIVCVCVCAIIDQGRQCLARKQLSQCFITWSHRHVCHYNFLRFEAWIQTDGLIITTPLTKESMKIKLQQKIQIIPYVWKRKERVSSINGDVSIQLNHSHLCHE